MLQPATQNARIERLAENWKDILMFGKHRVRCGDDRRYRMTDRFGDRHGLLDPGEPIIKMEVHDNGAHVLNV